MENIGLLDKALNDLKQYRAVIQLAMTHETASVEQLKAVLELSFNQCGIVIDEIDDFLMCNDVKLQSLIKR